MPRFIAATAPTVMVRHIPGGQLEALPLDWANRLLRAGVVELAGAPQGWDQRVNDVMDIAILKCAESAMLAPTETAMLPAARAKRRGRKRG